ncbi:MAG: hypothetical protein FWH21_07175 [Kiritimatiellaeota bacterium]|nr:hypothetical protein [Kiritimatiellota bacterium]
MAVITIDEMGLCGVGADPVRSGYGPALKQRFDCAANPLAGSRKYAALHFPKGFVPRNVVVNVLVKAAAGTLSAGTNQMEGSAQVVFEAAVPLTQEGPVFVNAESGGKKFTADDETFLVIIPGADIGDAIFDVVVTGDWMLGAWDAPVGGAWPPEEPNNVI